MEEIRKMFEKIFEKIKDDPDFSRRIEEISLDWNKYSTMQTIEVKPVIKIKFYEN